jgi:hypothetical protein
VVSEESMTINIGMDHLVYNNAIHKYTVLLSIWAWHCKYGDLVKSKKYHYNPSKRGREKGPHNFTYNFPNPPQCASEMVVLHANI